MTAHIATTAKNLALMLEVACDNFETLRRLIGNELVLHDSVNEKNVSRAKGCIQMALAKNFIFHVVRARRICEHGKSSLSIDRNERTKFMKATETVVRVRDANEHGFEPNCDENSRPMMNAYFGGMISIDDTSLGIFGEDIHIGPLKLNNIYKATNAFRNIAGFASQHRSNDTARLLEKRP